MGRKRKIKQIKLSKAAQAQLEQEALAPANQAPQSQPHDTGRVDLFNEGQMARYAELKAAKDAAREHGRLGMPNKRRA